MEREVIEFDVVFAGGGPANLSSAIHLTNLVRKHNEEIENGTLQGEKIDIEDKIAVLEKGASFGAHNISGAVFIPDVLSELLPDHKQLGCPIDAEVDKESIYFLTTKGNIRIPFTPQVLNNHGNYLLSLSRFVGWLAQIAEKNKVMLLEGTAAVEILYEGTKVTGVRTDDKRLQENGEYETPGYILNSKVIVLGEGSNGTLRKNIVEKLHLDQGRAPSLYELGVKEIYELKSNPLKKGECIHTLGYPFRKGLSGGGFVYCISETQVVIGLIAHLSSEDPQFDPHKELQKYKQHPLIFDIIKDGKPTHYGARTLPCGGYFSIPKLTSDGVMITGDSANLVDSQKLKGLHTSIKSGMLAAEVLFEAFRTNDFSANQLAKYEEKLKNSWIYSDLRKGRNFTPAVAMGVPFPGGLLLGFQMVTGGATPIGDLKTKPDYSTTRDIKHFYGSSSPEPLPRADDRIIVSKLTDVYFSGTSHDEKQKSHIRLRDDAKCKKCIAEYNASCTAFCPAGVYELEGDKIRVNFSNCLHCKTCDLKCPFENIIWDLPEGGGGPKYTLQ
ncbi:MAG: electron transfer flavoprotein-ubiquinone oxidoreductase [Thermodesulfovibrionales bacterium]|nr:electron transfer flavoprotein-ubiquinone oxidoreductase [Thermodesulfovibrionales bacterium]